MEDILDELIPKTQFDEFFEAMCKSGIDKQIMESHCLLEKQCLKIKNYRIRLNPNFIAYNARKLNKQILYIFGFEVVFDNLIFEPYRIEVKL